jgi:hypothetical protein
LRGDGRRPRMMRVARAGEGDEKAGIRDGPHRGEKPLRVDRSAGASSR